MKVIATIEARMSSTRLPGKVMLPLAGKPMLEQLINRIRCCRHIDEVMIVSSTRTENKVIGFLAEKLNVPFFAGSEEDVLDRLLSATNGIDVDVIVQLTGDNPAISPQLIDDVVEKMLVANCDYVSNYLTQSPIIGQNLRCFKRSALVQADHLCKDEKMRSHGGYYIQTRPDIFNLQEVKAPEKVLRDDIRLTVDEPEDYYVMDCLFSAFSEKHDAFELDDILDFFEENPDVARRNHVVKQKIPGEG